MIVCKDPVPIIYKDPVFNSLDKSIVCRFAPTTSGRAHPGTLLAGLLAWLDAKKQSARFILRMEDIDPLSVRDHWRKELLSDLEWFGLTWDKIVWQSELKKNHESAMDILAQKDVLYKCKCTRGHLRKANLPSLSGGYIYPGTCRAERIREWRDCKENIRCDLSGMSIDLIDESGLDLSQNIGKTMGDPVVRRRDGSFTYHLAVVADDNASGVTRIVRGRDIADSTATQVAFYNLLGYTPPQYRHHLLLLEPRGEKFAKFHGAVGADILRKHYSPEELCGFLAWVANLKDDDTPCKPEDLLECFNWERVATEDQVVDWTGEKLIGHFVHRRMIKK